MFRTAFVFCSFVCLLAFATPSFAQGSLSGTVRDANGGALPGVAVDVRPTSGVAVETTTGPDGTYRLEHLNAGRYRVSFGLVNFGIAQRDVTITAAPLTVNVVLQLSMNAQVTVNGAETFKNLADVPNPTDSLVGIADAASQGAITPAQVDARPLMRTGEVMEAIPGMITTQHSGEGKANQYFLRGFNLDHGTDFAQTVAGMPVNLPTNAHGQGYSDINFLMPELVSGVQFSKGPYYASQGDFATAGASNINYVTSLDHPIARLEGGMEGYARGLLAGSMKLGTGTLLAAGEVDHDDGPWTDGDNYRKLNGVLRYSRGTTQNGFALTAMAYHGDWNSTDQVPDRAITDGLIPRFGSIDPTDGGHSDRDSVSMEWQRTSGNTLTHATAYGIRYDLDLFSNFTYFLDDPAHGDQFEQADHRFIAGGQVSQERLTRWFGRPVQNTVGLQLRNDDVTNVGLYHTEARVRLEPRSVDGVVETSVGAYGESQITWTPWLRTMMGLRADVVRFDVTDKLLPVNSGIAHDGLVSPKGGVTFGPWHATEFYLDAGEGFHSNDARGTTISVDVDGNPVARVTPLVRAKGSELGVRTVAIPHVQTTVSVWQLRLASELVFSGDSAGSEPSRSSARHGIEIANYVHPRPWLLLDADVSWSQARFTQPDPVGDYVPEAVGTVVSAGASLDHVHGWVGSMRWRYFGPRALIEDNSVRSKPTSLIDLEAGRQLTPRLRLDVGLFNLLNAADSDVDYYYVSRLPGEPAAGVADIHTHPTLPRTARVTLRVQF
jgi:hypothetical protein